MKITLMLALHLCEMRPSGLVGGEPRLAIGSPCFVRADTIYALQPGGTLRDDGQEHCVIDRGMIDPIGVYESPEHIEEMMRNLEVDLAGTRQ